MALVISKNLKISHSLVAKWISINKGTCDASVGRSKYCSNTSASLLQSNNFLLQLLTHACMHKLKDVADG